MGETLEGSEFYSQRDGEDSPSEILEKLTDYPESVFEEYRYLFKEGKWFVEFGFWGERDLEKAFTPSKEEEERERLKYYLYCFYCNYNLKSQPNWRTSLKEQLSCHLEQIQEAKKVEFSLSFEELEVIKKKSGKNYDSLLLEAGIENVLLELERIESLFRKEEGNESK